MGIRRTLNLVACATASLLGLSAFGADPALALDCPVSHGTLEAKLKAADAADESGLNNHYWAVVVNRAGVVCAVAYSGPSRDSQWLLSRQIAAAKAFTANGLSLDNAPISTGALYSWVLGTVPKDDPFGTQSGPAANPLQGLFAGNILNAAAAYHGPYGKYGTADDPMVGEVVGGTITFGGGLGLYTGGSNAVGGLGLSGDTACADHSTAWRVRKALGLAPTASDAITLGASQHPACPGGNGGKYAVGSITNPSYTP